MSERKEDKKPEPTFKFHVDNKPFEQDEPTITGTRIKQLVGVPTNYGVWLVVPGPAEDEEIGDNQNADLSRPGVEKFITGPKQTTEGSDEFLARG